MANITKSERKTQMFSIVEQWQNGSATKKDVCKKHNVNICTFNYWLKKYRSSSVSSDFIELKPKAQTLIKERIIKFNFSGKVLAEVPADIAINFMHQLIVL